MKLRFFGHAAFQLDVDGVSILVDPFISENPLAQGVVSAQSLSPDVILLTHAHGDHWGDTPEIAAQSGALVVANYEITTYLTRMHGYDRVLAMNTGGSWQFDWGRLTQTYARHSSSFPDGTYGGNPNGYLMEVAGKTIYALGDTCPFAEMEWIGNRHAIDVAMIPIGDCFTMGPRDAVHAADMIKPRLTIPVHYDTFPPIEVDASKWAALMAEAGHATCILGAGESMEL